MFKNQIDEVILQLEAGKISEEEAHIKIAEITTDMPEQERLSEGVKDVVEVVVDQKLLIELLPSYFEPQSIL